MEQAGEHTYFFTPYVGGGYDGGFNGLKSLVVGVCHICDLECDCHHLCSSTADVRGMDCQCPCYKTRTNQEYYRLSNSNEIEIESFINGEAHYPAYKHFTYYMLQCAGDLPPEKRRVFWDNVAFTNFLQSFHSDSFTLPKDLAMYDEAYTAFKEVVDELCPDIIYVWNEQVRDTLKRHKEDIRYIGKADMQCGINLYVFSPVASQPKPLALSKLRYRLGIQSEVHRIGWYVKLLTKHIGKSIDVDGDRGKIINSLANNLLWLVEEGILGATETNLYFRDTKDKAWTSLLKGLFLSAVKDQYPVFGRGFNPGMAEIFGEKNLATNKRDATLLKESEKDVSDIIMRVFPKSVGKTFPKVEDKKKS